MRKSASRQKLRKRVIQTQKGLEEKRNSAKKDIGRGQEEIQSKKARRMVMNKKSFPVLIFSSHEGDKQREKAARRENTHDHDSSQTEAESEKKVARVKKYEDNKKRTMRRKKKKSENLMMMDSSLELVLALFLLDAK